MRVDWSPLALRRVNQIIDRIAKHNVRAAQNWIGQLLDTVELLGQFPRRGRRLNTIKNAEIRHIWVGMYRVIYTIDRDWVQVLTVRHGMQRELRRYRRR
ncbi:MAG: type II toxin-antitoxin system RelE/ParE family toxin [Candidatus Hydrogenedentes bacterium]|nr:type II toxin-antitoxin system RelE/ParE family toxin [Candidatus Hydrogenedentota bacterium]